MSGFQTKKTKEKRFKRCYLSKSQAKRYLQLDNKEFKRILIFKGIYPRVPKKLLDSKSKDKIYYATKEIKKLLDDPIITKLREYQTHLKKASVLSAQGDDEANRRIESFKPQYDLSSTILERYPTFSAALADLTDALSMTFLYSILPPAIASETTIEGPTYLTTAMHRECKEISSRWRDIVAAKRALRKGFISIRGFFYEAVLDDYASQAVRWLEPHNLASSKPSKAIEHRVMLNYLEFYISFLKFVCFKLESDMNREIVAKAEEAIAAGNSEPPRVEAPQEDRFAAFHSLTFFVSRECNPTQLGFVLRNLGCGIAKEYTAEDLTHYVIDRPSVPFSEAKRDHVDYVQPQYVFDCLNQARILPVAGYGIGAHCPPHVSPFVQEDELPAEDVPIARDAIAEIEEEASESEREIAQDDSEDEEIREAPHRSSASAQKVHEQRNFSETMKKAVKPAKHKSDESFGTAQAVNMSKRMRGLYTAAKHAHTKGVEKKQQQQLKRSQIQQGALGVSECGKFLQPK